MAMAGMWITRLGIKAHVSQSYPDVIYQIGFIKCGEHVNTVATIMQGEVWSSLPEDILDRVISRLPLQSLVRMRSVCKKWKIKLRTASFIRQCEEVVESTSANQWLLTFTSNRSVCLAYDTHLAKWHSVSLGFLPFVDHHVGNSSQCYVYSPLAAADGLICLGCITSVRPTKLVVCNPVSRFWRDVPLPSQLSVISATALVVDRVGGAYKLVVVGEVGIIDLVAFVFDSASQRWSDHHEVEQDDPTSRFSFLVSHVTTRAVMCSAVCEGVLYCLTTYQLHAFGVVTKLWTRLRVSLPAEISAPNLVARPGGRLFLVGSYRHNHRDNSNNIGIWELDTDTQRWAVVDVLLDHQALKCSSLPAPRSSSRRNVADDCDDVTLFLKWATRFLAYNVSKKSWVWLPTCSAAPSLTSTHPDQPHHHGFLITPSMLLP